MALTTATTATSLTFSAEKQVSDQNSQGSNFGASATDPIIFYATSGAIPQPGVGPANAFVGAGVFDTGLLTKYQALLATSSVGATTTAEVTSSCTGLLATDVIAVNKPAAQAGLGVVGYRVTAANALGVTFSNISSGAITNTTADVWDVIGVSGNLTTTAALTPAAVAASVAGNEQVFAVPGATVGSFPIVNKPTAQTGIGISNVRVVSAGQVAITYANLVPTATTSVTPTAETYSFAFLPTLAPASQALVYKVAVATTSVAATTTTDQTSTITGILANDTIAGVSKPSYQAAVGIVGYRVTAASTVGITYVSQSSGAITSTLEAYRITVLRQVANAPFVVTSAALTPVSVAATTSAEQTFTVPSLTVSTSVLVSKPSFTPGIHIVGCRVSAASTLAITYQNNNTTAVVPPAETYTIASIPLQGPGAVATTGTTTNSIAVAVLPMSSAVKDLRTALANLNLLGAV